ncbi:MAG: DUF58 domain-containing protein [Alphaproteobacteria bacterium]
MSSGAARTVLDAQALGDTLPGLVIAARRIAANVAFGVHGRRRPGSGESFWQFRRYGPGDPARAIDWRRSARTRTLYVREREWAVAATVRLWRDTSPSMDYASGDDLPSKARRAEVLLLALASLLLRGGERVALLGRSGPALAGQFAMPRLAEHLTASAVAPSTTDNGAQTSALAGLPVATPLPAGCDVLLIGDFLDDLSAIEDRLGQFAAMGARCHLVHILDPAEELLPFSGRTRFQGLENEGALLVGRAESLQEPYRRTMAARMDSLVAMARHHGWTYTRHRTDHRPEPALLALSMALAGD